MGDIVIFIGVISTLIFFHELGHFIAAKSFGIKVESFSVGFGKKLLTKHYKGTDWSISLIPFGGYIMMKYDLSNLSKSKENSDNLAILHPLKKIVISFAGPFANIIVAFVICVFIGMMEHKEGSTKIGSIGLNSSAHLARLQVGDKIISINGEKVRFVRDYIKISKAQQYRQFNMIIERNGHQKSVVVIPKVVGGKDFFGNSYKKNIIGVTFVGNVLVSFDFFESIFYGYERVVSETKVVLFELKKLLVGTTSSGEFGGVVMMGKVISVASESGLVVFLGITALISINIAVFNLLPIPAFDGGQILIHLYELCTTKIVSEKIQDILTYLSLVVIFAILALGLYNDFNRYFW